ncbi:conserved protein, unknown function [Hepatocystis sp. ex Piliocolobus tephrosceles]|nr:conserved protein, unknown function [Hepatocystis sp. ex Piliocolobus tephrosceles]
MRKIINFILFCALIFFINLFLIKSRYTENESIHEPLNMLFNKETRIRRRLCNECFYKNEVILIYNSCKAIEKARNNNIDQQKIYYFIRQSPRLINKYCTMKNFYKIKAMVTSSTMKYKLTYKINLVLKYLRLLINTYVKNDILTTVNKFLRSVLMRCIVLYLLQVVVAFLIFHYVNMVMQKIQQTVFSVSGSNYSAWIVGILQINLVSYYANVLSEFVQFFFMRIMFNSAEAQLIQSALYNSLDYYISTASKSKLEVLYQCTKKFVRSRFHKFNLHSFNYLRYIVLTNIFFKLTKGTYNKFSPSDIQMPGVYANIKKGIVKDMSYATRKELEQLREISKETGCHTCGAACSHDFIGDHQPPVQTVKDLIEYYKDKKVLLFFAKLFRIYDLNQRLYPQCSRCSQLQSASVRCKKRKLITHYKSLRLFHLSTVFYLLLKIILLTGWGNIVMWDKTHS